MPMNPRLLRPRASGAPLLLDTYTGAAAAYSLRQLRRAHTTAVVRVRRSSDNAEADFLAIEITNGTLAGWVGAGNGGFVVTWYDQSGNARNVTQATAANQPTIVSAGAVVTNGGKPCVDFDGSNDRLIHSGSAISTVSLLSQFVVAQTRGATVSHFVASAGQNVNGEGGGVIYTANEEPKLFIWGVIPEATGAQNTTSRVLMSSVVNGTALNLFVNGGSATTATAGSSLAIDTGNIHLGGSLNDASPLPFPGIIQEALFWFSNQTTNRTAIRDALNTHYAVY